MLCDYCQKQRPFDQTIDVERLPDLLSTVCKGCVGKVLNLAHDLLDALVMVDGLHDDGYPWRPRETEQVKALIIKAKKLLE